MARRPPVRLPALAAVHLRALSHQEMRAPAASRTARRPPGPFPLSVASAVATSLTINATGAVNLKLTPLILPEEVDAASKKQTSYCPPGQ
jgi:hypothetical protein